MTFQRCNAPFQTRGMRSFLASAVFEVRVHLQPSVSHLGHGRAKCCETSNESHLAKLQVSRKEVQGSHKNVINSKTKQLLFNVA